MSENMHTVAISDAQMNAIINAVMDENPEVILSRIFLAGVLIMKQFTSADKELFLNRMGIIWDSSVLMASKTQDIKN